MARQLRGNLRSRGVRPSPLGFARRHGTRSHAPAAARGSPVALARRHRAAKEDLVTCRLGATPQQSPQCAASHRC
jgi:hypothetical protein